jgi:AcrR family transcriptional regulator
MTADVAKTRRTEGVRTHGRAERIVEAVLRATVELLSEVGYAALRVEDVAARSGVNKTTIYRRWPAKDELVGAALRAMAAERSPTIPNTGNLREDLFGAVQRMLEFASSPFGAGIMRMIQVERANPGVDAIARNLRDLQRATRRPMFERAIARGELPRGTNIELMSDMIFSPVFAKLTKHLEPIDEAYVRALIEVAIRGAAAVFASRR